MRGNVRKAYLLPQGVAWALGMLLMAASGRAQNLFEAGASGNISEFTPNGMQSTFATGFYDPYAIAFNSAGNLFVGDRINDNIFEVAPDGTQTIFTSLSISPRALAFNGAGVLFVAGSGTDIYEVTPDGTSSVFGFGVHDVLPNGLAFDRAGNLFAANQLGQILFEFSPDGTASPFYNGLSGALAFDGNGDLFVGRGSDINEFINNNGTLSTTPVLFASGLDSPSALAFQVPEPSAVLLAGLSAAALWLWRRCNNSNK
jgi:hypothetical protein